MKDYRRGRKAREVARLRVVGVEHERGRTYRDGGNPETVADHFEDFWATEIDRGDLPSRVRDTCLGRTLDWSDTLRGYYFFGTGEIVRAGFVRRNLGDRFEPATEKGKRMDAVRLPHEPQLNLTAG